MTGHPEVDLQGVMGQLRVARTKDSLATTISMTSGRTASVADGWAICTDQLRPLGIAGAGHGRGRAPSLRGGQGRLPGAPTRLKTGRGPGTIDW